MSDAPDRGEAEETNAASRRRSFPLAPITRTASGIGSLMIVCIMIMINTDVGFRYVFNNPLPGVAEIVSTGIVSIIFLQLPDCIRAGRMIRSDMWITRLAQTRPRIGLILDAVFHAIGTTMLAVLVFYIFPEVEEAVVECQTIGVHGVFVAPIGPFYICVIIGAVLAMLEYALCTVDRVRQALSLDVEGSAS